MSQVEFFKATSRGGLDPIENSTDSLHSRRSILIKDDINSTLWLIHGSATAKTTRQSAIKNADRINDENHGAYDILDVDYDTAEQKIQEILTKKSKNKKSKKADKISIKSIPKVPKLKKVEESSSTLPGDIDHSGPEIEEFQISYYLERDPDIDVNDPDIQPVFELISSLEKEVKDIIINKPSKTQSKKKLRQITDDIINLIYQ